MRSKPLELLAQFCNGSLQNSGQQNRRATLATCMRIAYTAERPDDGRGVTVL